MKRVYFLRRSDGTGPIKIGCSARPEDRRYQLGVDLKSKFVIITTAGGTFRDERNAHLKFAHLRVETEGVARKGYIAGSPSEWFAPAPELLEFIEKVKATGVLPLEPGDCREKIFAERYRNGETLQQIANDYEITRERVRQILRNTGVESLGLRPQHRRPPHELTDDELLAVKLYRDGTQPKKIIKRTGLARHQIVLALRRCGVPAKPMGYWQIRPDDAELTREVCRLYQAGIGAREIVRRLPQLRFPETVYRYLEKGGVPARNRELRFKLETKAPEIIAAYLGGLSQVEVAAKFSASVDGVRGLLHRHGIRLPRAEAEKRRIAAVVRANKRRSANHVERLAA